MSEEITAYFIGGPFDLTKRRMVDPGGWYAMAVMPPLRVPPFKEEMWQTAVDSTIEFEQVKYRRLGRTHYDYDTVIFEYEPP